MTYIRVPNELAAAYSELRNKAALNKFGEKFNNLNKIQQKEIKKMYPQKISEAELKTLEKMSKFRKKWKKGMQAISTHHCRILSSCFFLFMVTTVMRETTLFVSVSTPKATEIKKLEKKVTSKLYLHWTSY